LHGEISDWQYAAIVTTLLNQRQQRLALTFMAQRNAPTVKSEDIELRLKVLLKNGLVLTLVYADC
jgi:hypothetical protein